MRQPLTAFLAAAPHNHTILEIVRVRWGKVAHIVRPIITWSCKMCADVDGLLTDAACAVQTFFIWAVVRTKSLVASKSNLSRARCALI